MKVDENSKDKVIDRLLSKIMTMGTRTIRTNKQ